MTLFLGFPNALLQKRSHSPSDGRQMSRLLFFCSRVLSCVVTYSFDPLVSLGERISGEGSENKARVRGALTKRKGKTEFWTIECIEHMHAACGQKVEKTYEILRQIGWIYMSCPPFSFPFCVLRLTYERHFLDMSNRELLAFTIILQ